MNENLIKSRLRRNPPRKDGSRGMLYLRVRISPAPELKSEVFDVPMETNDRAVAVRRAGFLLRSLLRLGRRIVGDLGDVAAIAPPKPDRKYGASAAHAAAGARVVETWKQCVFEFFPQLQKERRRRG